VHRAFPKGASRNELIGFSSDYCYVEGVFSTPGNESSVPVSIGFNREQRVSMKVNAKQVSSFSQWLGHGMAVSFGPEDLALVQGVPKDRRNFLDIFISQIDTAYLSRSYRTGKALPSATFCLQRRSTMRSLTYTKKQWHGTALLSSSNAGKYAPP